MPKFLSGCPPTIAACAPQQPDPWPFDGTPGTLLTSSYVLAGCALVLLATVLILLFLSRERSLPIWKSKVFLAMMALDLLAIIGALYARTVSLSYSQPGLSPYASFSDWQGHLTATSGSYLVQMAFTYEILTAVMVALTLACVWVGVRRARADSSFLHASQAINR